jgi:hypothetical protein
MNMRVLSVPADQPKQTKQSEIEQRLEHDLRDVASTETRITRTKDFITNTLPRFHQEIDKALDDVTKQLQTVNQAIVGVGSSLQNEANKALDSVSEDVRSLDETVDKILLWTEVIVILLLVAYVTWYLRTFQLQITLDIVPGLTPILVLVLIRASVRSMRKDRNKYVESLNADFREAYGRISTYLGWQRKISPEFGRVKEYAGIIVGTSEKIASDIIAYVPLLNTYYERKEIKSGQADFVRSLKNALSAYGFKIEPNVDIYLRTFGPSEKSLSEWLSKSSRGLESRIGVSSSIIRIIYSDYVGDEEDLKNGWAELKRDKKAVTALCALLLRNKVVDVELIDEGNPQPIVSLVKQFDIFTLDIFRRAYYTFYIDLARKKLDLLNALSQYGLGDQFHEDIMRFPPSSQNWGEYAEELFDFAGGVCKIPPAIVSLFYWDYVGQNSNRQESWAKIRRDENAISKLADLLKDVLVESSYPSSSLSLLIANLLRQSSDFSLPVLRNSISVCLSRIEDTKRAIRGALHAFKLGMTDRQREEFVLFLPTDSEMEKELIRHVSKPLGIDERILELFYLHYLEERRRRDELYANLKQRGLHALSSLMVEKQLVDVSDTNRISAVANLDTILTSLAEFQLAEVQSTFRSYSEILALAHELISYTRKNDLTKADTPSFEQLVALLKDKLEESAYFRLKTILENVLGTEMWISALNRQEVESVVMACLTAFFVWKQDFRQREAALQAYTRKLSVRILYQYYKLGKEGEKGGKQVLLKEIIDGVSTGKFTDYQYIVDYEAELSNGMVFTSIDELLKFRVEAIEKRVKIIQEELSENLDDMKGAVRDILETEISEDFIEQSLNAHLLTAYMITNPVNEPIITEIIDDALPKVCASHAETDARFKDFLILAEDKTVGGRSTRIGLVPPSLRFEEFSDMFEIIFKEAVELYAQRPDRVVEKWKFAAHLIRVFPLDTMFRLVRGESMAVGTPQKESPVYVVRRLCIERLGIPEELWLLGLSRGAESGYVVMKNVLTKLLDKAGLIGLAKSRVEGYVSKTMTEKMESRQFDIDLIKAWQSSSITELALSLYKQKELAGKDAERLKRIEIQFRDRLKGIIDNYRARMTNDDLSSLADTLFTLLCRVGKVLELT